MLVSDLKTRMPLVLQAPYSWDATDQEQGRFEGRSSHSAKELVDRPLDVRGHLVRIIADIAPDRRPMSKAQTIWINTTGNVGLERISLTSIGWIPV